MAAVRAWVRNGGKLWLMLDLLQENTVNQLLGGHFPFETVDRLSLVQGRVVLEIGDQQVLLDHVVNVSAAEADSTTT